MVHHTIMSFVSPSFWKDRFQASAIHLTVSLTIALLAGLLVFGLWYPYPYREISGGRELFVIVVTVDVILGPLITLAIFNRAKPWCQLRFDLAVVALLQLVALGYGLWTVFVARPVHLVFEYSRFSVVHAIEVPQELLPKAPAGLDVMPVTGPTLLSLRPFKDNNEKIDATMAALSGLSLSARPDLWQPYTAAVAEVYQVAKPVSQLKARFPDQVGAIDAALAGTGDAASAARYVPLAGRKDFWTVLVDGRNGDILGFVALDSF